MLGSRASAMPLWSSSQRAVGDYSQQSLAADTFKDTNSIFFEDVFKTLIIVGVLLLLLSLFIISTILIRLSFFVDGLVSTSLVVVAFAFGLLVLWIHDCYSNLEDSEQRQPGSK